MLFYVLLIKFTYKPTTLPLIKNKEDINDLTHSVSEDNRSAFNMLYHAYYDRVFCYAYHFIRNKEECREVVLDTFFSIWKSRRKLKDVTNLDAYIYIATKNEAIRHLNRKTAYEVVSLDEFSIDLKNEDEICPEQKFIIKEIEILLTQIISQLPEKCRLIFLMARQDGLKPKEIAEILSITESTVRVQMKIAIEKIIAMIRPHFPDLTLTFLFSLFTQI